MFTLWIEKYGIIAFLVIGLSVVAFGTGYYKGSVHGEAVCNAAHAEKEQERQAEVILANERARRSDQDAVKQKARADELARKLWRKNRDEMAALPDRSCGFTPDERRVLERQIRGE